MLLVPRADTTPQSEPLVVLCALVDWTSQQAVAAMADNSLQLWDLMSGRVVRTFHGHQEQITCISVHWPSRRLVSAPPHGLKSVMS